MKWTKKAIDGDNGFIIIFRKVWIKYVSSLQNTSDS